MKTVSATEAKNRLAALVGEVAQGSEDVVIENHGQPRAVLISYELYTELLEARAQQKRRTAMDALWQLRAEIQSQIQDVEGDSLFELLMEELDEVRAENYANLRGLPIDRAS